MTATGTRRQRLHQELLDAGAMTPDWRAAFEAVPRDRFLPAVMWPLTGEGYITVDRDADPIAWQLWADSDVPIVTQWDDGHHIGPGAGEEPTSSSSMPTMVASMFRDLAVVDGARVLEVGTGTGWCAGLLSARLGADRVTSVEVDAALAHAARKALWAARWRPTVVTGDGANGRPAGAPYDRVLATACARRIPAAWIAQTRPGGLIVTPWGTPYSQSDAIAQLTVTVDGAAIGRFTGPAGFMKLRDQRGDRIDPERYLPGGVWPDDARESSTAIARDELLAADWAIGLRVPDARRTVSVDGDATTLMVYGLTDASWAAVFWCDCCTEWDVLQGGPRALWQEVEAAYRWWAGADRPDVTRFGLTVTPDGQRVWLDDPAQIVSPLRAGTATA
ncbi:protein-L-isoaspartate(D-aspartate) O-methyltransferase [Actinoallomurus spadix]|uniref:Protein-L-isoaspartate O-methyltransferase n=1 Tax=Actinoallomurus spadix TaxID=79912 RepID=A0ABP3FLP2_9ACTN|nr:methyltransferase domain-containing protein [Actinoallomurus spadix]MCO5985822.1 protein-L-isoaspartate(D-aspartate) O-methyltransferase [Actinoallomurus spadix]